jgi:hypothetical protein
MSGRRLSGETSPGTGIRVVIGTVPMFPVNMAVPCCEAQVSAARWRLWLLLGDR